MYVQLIRWVGLFNGLRHLGDHFVEDGPAGGGESLRVGFLEKPQLFEGNDGVAAGDFEVELGGCEQSDGSGGSCQPTSSSSSSRLKTSDFWVCDQPRRAAKLISVAANTPCLSLKKLRSMSAFRLLSFWPDLSTRRGT